MSSRSFGSDGGDGFILYEHFDGVPMNVGSDRKSDAPAGAAPVKDSSDTKTKPKSKFM